MKIFGIFAHYVFFPKISQGDTSYKQLGIKYPFRSSIAIISIHIVMTVLEKHISVIIDQKENAN